MAKRLRFFVSDIGDSRSKFVVCVRRRATLHELKDEIRRVFSLRSETDNASRGHKDAPLQLMLNGYTLDYDEHPVHEILDDCSFLTFSSSDSSALHSDNASSPSTENPQQPSPGVHSHAIPQQNFSNPMHLATSSTSCEQSSCYQATCTSPDHSKQPKVEQPTIERKDIGISTVSEVTGKNPGVLHKKETKIKSLMSQTSSDWSSMEEGDNEAAETTVAAVQKHVTFEKESLKGKAVVVLPEAASVKTKRKRALVDVTEKPASKVAHRDSSESDSGGIDSDEDDGDDNKHKLTQPTKNGDVPCPPPTKNPSQPQLPAAKKRKLLTQPVAKLQGDFSDDLQVKPECLDLYELESKQRAAKQVAMALMVFSSGSETDYDLEQLPPQPKKRLKKKVSSSQKSTVKNRKGSKVSQVAKNGQAALNVKRQSDVPSDNDHNLSKSMQPSSSHMKEMSTVSTLGSSSKMKLLVQKEKAKTGRKGPSGVSSAGITMTSSKEPLPSQNFDDSCDSSMESHNETFHPESKKKGRDEKISFSSTPAASSRKDSSAKLLTSKPSHPKKAKKLKLDDSHVAEDNFEKKRHGDKPKLNGDYSDMGSSISSGTNKQLSKKAKKKRGEESQHEAAGKKNTTKSALVENDTKETEKGFNPDGKSQEDKRGRENSGEKHKSRREEKADARKNEDVKEVESHNDLQKNKNEKRNENEEKGDRSKKKGERNEEQRGRRDGKESQEQASWTDDSESEEENSGKDGKEDKEEKSSTAKAKKNKDIGNRVMTGNGLQKPLSQFSTPLLLDDMTDSCSIDSASSSSDEDEAGEGYNQNSMLKALAMDAKTTPKSKSLPTGNMVHTKVQSQRLVGKSDLSLSLSTSSSANNPKLHRSVSKLENGPSSSSRRTTKSGTSLELISQEEEKVALDASHSGNLSQIIDEEAYW